MNGAIDYLDVWLGRMTMYRLLIYGLSAISFMATALMISGYLPYSPIVFALSIVLMVGVSYGTNRLFGWLFGIRPHSESAIITGLILSLLFVPPVTIIAGLQLALVAVIAMASKYVLVFRGRHIFNPAAVAIVIASFSGLAYAAWWIATPALLPITIVVAGLILFKTRKLQMAGIFLAAAILAILIKSVITTGLSIDAVGMALTSWPLIFFAGVMLCEPLTLPPRRYQQFIEAAVVGLFLGTAPHVSTFTTTPATALIFGNLMAWYWSARGAIKLRFAGKKQRTPTIYDFEFDSNKPYFLPGQYLELTLVHPHADARGMRRMFSIIGQPHDERITIGTRIPEKPSSFKRALTGLKVGQTVYATRIAGDFVLPRDKAKPIVLIAGGIGITPYVSHIMDAGNRNVSLIYAVSSLADLAYVDQLRQYDIDVTIVSPDDGLLPDSSWRHVKAPYMTREPLEQIIRRDERPLVYISGPPAMVNSTKRIVRSLGLAYKTDHFAGY